MIAHILKLIAPDDCLVCGREGLLWCEWCRLDSEALPSRCFKCHALTANYDVCERCKRTTSIKRLYVIAEYRETAKELVAALKFKSMRQASVPIARSMAELLPLLESDTIVTNLPTAPVRRRQRGFDHTEYIGRELAAIKGLTFRRTLRKLDNNRQVGSSRKQRLEQAKNAYRLKYGVEVEGKNVLLVDDVVTTGASLQAAIITLKKAGAKRVDAIVFAYSK